MLRRQLSHRKLIVWVAGTAALLASGGCATATSANWLKNGLLDPTQVGNFEKSPSNEIRDSISILEEPTEIQTAEEPTAEDVAPALTEQRIGPGDGVSVSMYEVLAAGVTTTVPVRVGYSGYETFPVIGPVPVVGLTPRELELELKERIRAAGVLEDADVQVSLVQSQAAAFSIVGNIARPSTYPLPRPDYRLLEGIAAAGGIPPLVDKIYVFRSGGAMPKQVGADSGKSKARENPKAELAVQYSMSETSSGRVCGVTEPPGSQGQPPTTEGVIDELDILEGQPVTTLPAPVWDPERGEWIIAQPESKEGVREAPVETRPLAATASAPTRPGTGPGVEREVREAEPWEEPVKELAPPLRIIEIPVKELLDGDPRYNICIRSFDTINVPPGSVGEFYLGGNVARPGAYALTGRRITVKQAIVSAGGFGPLAWPARAELVRRVSKDEEQIIQLDLDAIFAGKAPDFYVKPNDIVNVGTTAASVFMAVLRNAFRFSYGFGFVYDRNFADSDTFEAKEQVKSRRAAERLQRGLPP